jgi:5-methyltetrahydrofolate--homocysteine methyltransferase
MDSYYSFRALKNLDNSCEDFINYALQNQNIVNNNRSNIEYSLCEIIERGLVNNVNEKAMRCIEDHPSLDLINNEIIPALNKVGKLFEEGKLFLPQLLNSAESAGLAFTVIKDSMPQGTLNGDSIILATVKGDIHDIGKNIVKLLLESYGFTVHDLGKNVASEKVVDAVKQYNCKLVALSALMTTTLDAMKETIIKLKEYDPNIRVMVGGAVLNQEIAKSIGADAYGADAMSAVRYAQEFYK